MIDKDYILAIEELKKRFPEHKEVEFDLNNGELSYSHNHLSGITDMKKMQSEINEILGQSEYIATLQKYETCYARNEKEAKMFINTLKTDELLHIGRIIKK